MVDPYLLVALILLATAGIGLIKILLGHDRVERLLALQLLGTTAVAVVLLLAQRSNLPGLHDLALVLGLLASTVAVAFVQFGGVSTNNKGENE